MALLDDKKIILRQNGTGTDTEVNEIIEAAKADLALSGVTKTDVTDPLISRAISLYCKANYGYDNPEAARFQECYDSLKAHLSLSVDYSRLKVMFSVTADGVAVDEATVIFDGETKQTGTAGTVDFYVFKGLNYEYTVEKDGYTSQTTNIDINAATTVNIALVVV